jgi:hypothetical protein
MLTRRAACATLLGGCLIVFDAMLLVGFYTERFDWLMALAPHLVLSVAMALPGLHGAARGGSSTRQSAMLQLAAWTALLGPFGVLIGMTLFLPKGAAGAGAVSQGMAVPGAEGDAMPSHLEALHNALLDGRLRLEGGHTVRPLLDIVIEGTTPEKLDALGLIAKRYAPALAPALKRALQDANASVRVLAATVMAQLHNGHTRRIGALQDAAQAAPTAAAWRTLGEARLAYAASGLLEVDRANREADEGDACLARADALERAEVPPPPAVEGGTPDGVLEAACHGA